MSKKVKVYRVFGHTNITVSVLVKAESEKDAIEKGRNSYGRIVEFIGNGDMGLIGPQKKNCDQTISADEDIEFDDCMEELM